MARQNVSITLVAMIDKSSGKTSSGTTSSGPMELQQDDSCPRPVLNTTTGVPVRGSTYGPKFPLTSMERSLVFQAFFWTYVTCQIPAARLAETYGAKGMLATAGIGSAVLNLAMPWAATNNFYLFILARALLGVIQAGLFPSVYVLYSKWLPPEEQSIALPLLRTGMYLGAMSISAAAGYFSEHPEFGWPYAYYSAGLICACWSVVWLIFSSSSPVGNRFVSREEVEYILTAIPKKNVYMATDVIDWRKVFSSPQVIALIVCYLSSDWASTSTLQQVPTYLNDILHIPPFKNGLINSVLFTIICINAPTVGSLSAYMIRKKTFGLGSYAVRRLFQSIALFSQSACLFIIPMAGCDIDLAIAILYIQVWLGSFTNGGQTQLPYEISPAYSGTIYAISNSIGSTTGFISPFVFGLMVNNTSSRSQWTNHFQVAAYVTAIGGFVFLLIGGNRQEDFAKQSKRIALGQLDKKLGGAEESKADTENLDSRP